MATGYPLQAALPTCKHHPDEELFFYCLKCLKRLCEKCCRGIHQTHEWRLAKKFAREIRQNTEARCRELEEMISRLSIDKEEERTKADIERIEKLRINWTSAINDTAEMLKVERRGGRLPKNSSEELKKLKMMLEFFRKDIHEADDNVVVEVEEEFHIKKENLSSQRNRGASNLVYKEGTLSTDFLHQMMGHVVEGISRSKVKVTEITHFIHINNADFISNIVPLTTNDALLTRHYGTHICHVDTTGKVIKELQTVCGDFIKIDNDIVITFFDTKMIRRVSPSGTVSDICSTAPLRPSGLCKSQDGGMLVCLSNCFSKSIKSDSMGEVHHFDVSGEVLHKFSHTEDKRNKLFINPGRIAQNINTDLCVVDTIDREYRSRLVVLSLTSEIRFVYTGQPTLMENFSSNDVCCDYRGRIIVTDVLNHTIHLLREDGHFLHYILTEQSPLWGPRSLALEGHTLWVGCEEGVVRVYDYNDEDC